MKPDRIPGATTDTGTADLQPTIEDGFTHLDLELAALLRRLVGHEGCSSPEEIAWWCAALSLASRAHGSGHTSLELPRTPTDRRLADAISASDAPPVQRAAATVQAPVDRQQALACFIARWAHEPVAPMPQAVRATGLMVHEAGRVYLSRLWACEVRVAHELAARARPLGPPPPARAQALLDEWLPTSEESPTADQQQACLQALTARLTVITGGPGTGKTHTAARALALLQALRPEGSPLQRIALAAPTGKAAARLRQALEQAWATLPHDGHPPGFWAQAWKAIHPPQTVHALLAQWRRDSRATRRSGALPAKRVGGRTAPTLQVDTLLVDEASMLDLELLDELLQALAPTTRLILIGDRDQLSSVEAGAVMSDICLALQGHCALAPLRHSRRFQGTIGRWAKGIQAADPAVLGELTAALNTQHSALVNLAAGPRGWQPFASRMKALRAADSVMHVAADCEIDAAWVQALQHMDDFRVLAAVRRGPWGVDELNAAIQRALAHGGWLSSEDGWSHGQVRMVTRNDESTGLRNGDVGVIARPQGQGPAQFVWLSGTEIRRIGLARLPPSEPSWVMSVHKSQGSEFSHVALALPDQDSPVLSRELMYTGLTRARHEVSLFGSRPELLTAACRRGAHRMSGLAQRLSDLLGSAPISDAGRTEASSPTRTGA